MSSRVKSNFLILAIPVLLALAAVLLRLPLMQARAGTLLGDESVFGIMVMDVLKGHFPIYYYGQSYMGTLEVYAAALFSLFSGVSGFTILFGSLFFYILFLITNFYLIRRIFSGQAAVFSSVLLLFPAWMLWEMGVRVLGAYSSILFLGALSLLLWVRAVEDDDKRYLFPLGFALGVGLWLSSLFLVHLLPLFLLTLFWKKDFAKRAHYLNPVRLFLLKDFSMPLWLKAPFFLIHLFVLAFLLKNVIVFFTGGWEWKLFSFDFSAPPFMLVRVKKLLLLLGIEAVLLTLLNVRWDRIGGFLKQRIPFVLGFFIGYLPALFYTLAGFEGYRIFHKSRCIYFSELFEKVRALFLDLLPQSVWGVHLDPKGMFLAGSPAALGVLIFFITALGSYFFTFRKDLKSLILRGDGIQRPASFFCLLAVGSVLLLTASSLVADRYFIFLCWVNAVVGGWFLARIFSRWKVAALALLFFIGSYDALEAGKHTVRLPRNKVARLVHCLETENIQGGFSNYDLASQISFYSAQRLRFLPLEGMIRTPHYRTSIDQLKRKGFVFRAHDDFEAKAEALHLPARTKEIKRCAGYVIYVVDKSSTPSII